MFLFSCVCIKKNCQEWYSNDFLPKKYCGEGLNLADNKSHNIRTDTVFDSE